MNTQYEYIRGRGCPIKAWVKGVPLEDAAREQLLNLSCMPFIHKHVAAMPDVHWGMGATIGSVIATKGAIIPAAVGVDIGCGMMAVKTRLTAADLPDNLLAIRSAIEAAVPHGRTDNGGVNDRGSWGADPEHAQQAMAHSGLDARLAVLADKHADLAKAARRAVRHIGTLGTGNHFIELCLDEVGDVWVMLHSGSRGIGNRIGMTFIAKAKKEMERWHINLPDKDLAYIPEGTEHFGDYMEAVGWAQDFASVNRNLMMTATLSAISRTMGRPVGAEDVAVNCHHNYVARENHFGANVLVTRKGAVRARKGDLGIIPGSMGAKSFIVRGRGNADSFNSCSHGAGRKMSRRQAKHEFTLDDHARATEGVECRKDAEVLDETPGAYKSIDAVMAAQSDLVEVLHTLKQVVCVKG